MKALFYLADQNPERDRARGITAYSRGLISTLLAVPGFALTTLTSKSSIQADGAGDHIRLPFRTDHFPGRIAADFLHPLWLPTVPLIHYPKGFLPGLRPKAKLVCGTVHDVILQHYIDHYPRARSRTAYAYWLHALKRSIPRFNLVLTVSEFSAAAIRAFCARHHLACPPIRVTYEGCRWENEPCTVVEKSDRVVHLGSTEPHKRTETVVRYWQKLQPAPFQLVVIGTVKDEVRRIIAEKKTIKLLPSLPSQELKKIITKSRCLLLPSEIEGFGLPAVESYALGTPVVYVRGTAVEEVLGKNTAGGFDLEGPNSFSVALHDVLNLSAQQVQEKRYELLARFSWHECGRKTIAAYREFCAE